MRVIFGFFMVLALGSGAFASELKTYQCWSSDSMITLVSSPQFNEIAFRYQKHMRPAITGHAVKNPFSTAKRVIFSELRDSADRVLASATAKGLIVFPSATGAVDRMIFYTDAGTPLSFESCH